MTALMISAAVAAILAYVAFMAWCRWLDWHWVWVRQLRGCRMRVVDTLFLANIPKDRPMDRATRRRVRALRVVYEDQL